MTMGHGHGAVPNVPVAGDITPPGAVVEDENTYSCSDHRQRRLNMNVPTPPLHLPRLPSA